MSPKGVVRNDPLLIKMLGDYAVLIEPWARSVARYMIADVNRRNERQWKRAADEMGRALRVEITYAPTGQAMHELLQENVALITSLPTKAAQRVHALTTEALVTSQRAADISKEIMRSGHVTKSRADLIARTEVARTASILTQSRAQHVGSEGYIWRTSLDGDVRETHKEQEGKYIRWDSPPKTDKNLAPYHAGQGPNCRCYPEPVLPTF